jgi:hypothetical protein
MTGENEHGLRSVMDFTRLVSIAILALHFYAVCHGAFVHWKWTAPIVDNIVLNFMRLPVFRTITTTKLSALVMLVVYLLGIKGKKDEKINISVALAYSLTGILFYFSTSVFLYIKADMVQTALAYMGITAFGYLLMVTGGSYLSRILKLKLAKDIFNKDNETFPQEEKFLTNEFSLNFPAKYQLKGKTRKSWINIINPFRGLLVAGTPGAGKTYFVVRNIIEQQIAKGFSMFLYDFKYDDLSKIAYNALLRERKAYKILPSFYIVNFDTPMHRCNPLEPEAMKDITDATESARTILLGLNCINRLN